MASHFYGFEGVDLNDLKPHVIRERYINERLFFLNYLCTNSLEYTWIMLRMFYLTKVLNKRSNIGHKHHNHYAKPKSDIFYSFRYITLKWVSFGDSTVKSTWLLLYDESLWRYNNVTLWISCDHHLEITMWSYHDSCFVTNFQVTPK